MLYLLSRFSCAPVLAKCHQRYLILRAVLICVLIVKFSALNCFEIDSVREENNLQTQTTGIYGAQWSIIGHNWV